MSSVLFLCHRIPFPPNKGDKLRSYHILKQLNKKHEVYLGALVDDPLDWEYASQLKKFVKDSCLVQRKSNRQNAPFFLKGLLTGSSLSNIAFYSYALAQWVDKLFDEGKIDAVYVFSSVMAQYIEAYTKSVPVLIDFVDVDSDKWRQFSSSKKFPMNVIYKLEGLRLEAYEKKVANASAMNFFVSDLEVDLFKKIAPKTRAPVVSMQNGVDTQFFAPHEYYTNPFQGHDKKIVFTGLMDYYPNVDAVRWFCKEVFGKLQKEYTNLCFYIVGANPSKEVYQLSGKNVKVTGRVPDIRPYLYHADLVVAPLRIARGIQNKVLEGMSMNKPIIASAQALEGIEMPNLYGVWQEQHPSAWIERILDLLVFSKEDLSLISTHDWIVKHYSWDAHLSQIDRALSKSCEGIQ